jgi:hypothetical protein
MITSVEKMNTLYYIPNAILIKTFITPSTTSNGSSIAEEYFFGSFIDRDPCHALISNMSKVAKSLATLPGSGPYGFAEQRSLIFGLQKDTMSDLVTNIAADLVSLTTSTSTTGLGNQGSSSTITDLNNPANGADSNNDSQHDSIDAVKSEAIRSTLSVANDKNLELSLSSNLKSSLSTQNQDLFNYEETSKQITSPNLKDLLTKSGVDILHSEILTCTLKDVWNHCWKDSSGYW